MKKLFIPICAGLVIMLGSTKLMAQESGKALIINTSSESEVKKVLASLKDADPSTYRLTVNTTSRGKTNTTVYGTAPIGALGKSSGSVVNKGGGGMNASDVVVIQKVITKSGGLQNEIISKLNKNLTSQSVKTISTTAVKTRNFK